MAFEERVDVHSELHDVRTLAIKNFENKGFPTKKDEAWKYTSLNAVLKNDFSVFPKNETNVEFKDVKKYFLHFRPSWSVEPFNNFFIHSGLQSGCLRITLNNSSCETRDVPRGGLMT